MTLGLAIAVTVVAAVIAAVVTRQLSLPGSLTILDVPNERSLHHRPTPRTGGLAIVSAIAVGWFAVSLMAGLPSQFAWISAGAATVAAVSFADDRGGVHAKYRLAIHLAAAAMLWVGGLRIERVPFPGVSSELGSVAGGLLTLLFVVWMTNLYNFMDGMDGFAGGMAVSGFGFVGYAFWNHGDTSAAVGTLVIAAGALGFLRFNFPPASIFMGDVGAASLGYLAAALALRGEHTAAMPLWASLVVFSPFIVDATVTLLGRLFRREKLWQAHRTHYYQRLVQLGWGHRKTVLCEYALMLTCGFTAIALLHAGTLTQQLAIAVCGGGYVAAMLAVARLQRRVSR